MRKRITLLIAALTMALTMSFGGVAVAKRAEVQSGPPGPTTCQEKAGQGQGGGEIKSQRHGSCQGSGAEF